MLQLNYLFLDGIFSQKTFNSSQSEIIRTALRAKRSTIGELHHLQLPFSAAASNRHCEHSLKAAQATPDTERGRKSMKLKKTTTQGNRICFWGVAILATVFRLVLTEGLMVCFMSGTQYDDIMQIGKAFSIGGGSWLGEYGPMTLVKGVGYPLLTAIFHWLKIPYVLGFHLTYVTGCVAFAWAIRPVVKNRLLFLTAYFFVLFNPVAFSASLTRYYRDIAYYAVCMVFIALMLGLLIRQRGKAAAAAAGFWLAVCILCREDGQWLYIYAVACVLAILLYRSITDKKPYLTFWKELLCMVAAYACVILCICGINYKYYKTFTVDEYNSGAYAEAYGALSRLHGEEGNTQVVIPYAERQKLYEYSPSFARLQPFLDGNDPRFEGWKIVKDDYRTGYFSFNLRDMISALGYYKDAPSTNLYLTQLANEVNEYCDTVSENAYRKRSTIVSRFYPEHIPQIALSTLDAMRATVTYTNISCIPLQCEQDDTYLQIFESFTHSTVAANRYMESGEIVENYHLTGFARWMQRAMRVLILIYQTIAPVLFCIAVLYLIFQTVMLLRKYTERRFVCWIAGQSLLALFLLRSFMIGYVDATSYSAAQTVSYLAASHAVLGCFIALQLSGLLSDLATKKKNRSATPKQSA